MDVILKLYHKIPTTLNWMAPILILDARQQIRKRRYLQLEAKRRLVSTTTKKAATTKGSADLEVRTRVAAENGAAE